MPVDTLPNPSHRLNRWRIAGWGVPTALALIPVVAMLVNGEFGWSPGDFVVAGALVFGVGMTFELLLRMSNSWAYRCAAAIALGTGFVLIWVNLAVGIIGSEDNPANLMYFGVVVVGGAGALIARFRPNGMAAALFAMVIAQVLVFFIALFAGWGWTVAATVFFGGPWLLSALLFRKAAREQEPQ